MVNNKKNKNKKNQQNQQNQQNKLNLEEYPFVSICTPTFNRRPFLPFIIKCFEHQTYPKERIEWIIIDDGTDKVEDLFVNIPQVKYFKYYNQMNLGKKRNLSNSKCKGDIIIYFDDDDYYPPERISHAVETLQKNPTALCAGSSEMYIFFKHIQQMYKFGPYGPNHATAATFAFRKELLNITKYDDDQALAEEKIFLKNYTIPFVQLDPLKTILVFSHIHNSFDKKQLLNQGNENPYVKLSDKKVCDFVKEEEIQKFFLEEIDARLENYKSGNPENKPEVLKQIQQIIKNRENMIKQQMEEQQKNSIIDQNKKINQLTLLVNELLLENKKLKEKIIIFEDKMKKMTQISNDSENTFNVRIVE
jgi:glycosyltransferase involved in cell wall biosynthesis